MRWNKKLLWATLMMVLLVSMTIVTMVNVTSAQETYIYVVPAEYDATGEPIGHLFPIDIYVNNAPHTYAWEIHVSWDPNLVKWFYKLEKDFLSNAGNTLFTTYPSTFEEANLQGEVMIGCTITDPLPIESWPSGNGWLCRIGFNVTGTGSCLINLFDTVLLDHLEAGAPAPTPYANEDTFFYTVDPSHDIKVTDVTVADASVYRGEVVNINVTVLDEGIEDESVTLNIYANATLIGTTVLSLNGTGSFENRSFTYEVTWNTTGFAEGNYTISATATAVLGETDTADNTLVDGTVYVMIPGDVNGDGTVDGSDLAMLDVAYGSEAGDFKWDEDCDFNGDSKVDVSDLFDLGENYGRSV